MGINKVQYGNTTLIDLTSDTVTADKLLQGYTAHDRSGTIITGTATQGGSVTQDQDGFIVLPPDGGGSPSVSGLEYEEGTWTPSVDTNGSNSPNTDQPLILFQGTHASKPSFVCLSDAGGDYLSTTYTMFTWIYTNHTDFAGAGINGGGTESSMRYCSITTIRRQTNATTVATAVAAYSSRYPNNLVFETGIRPYYGNEYYWRAGRTYKWIAVWR